MPNVSGLLILTDFLFLKSGDNLSVGRSLDFSSKLLKCLLKVVNPILI